jgi:NADH-quinone oxidoreductase subunit D
MPELRSETMTVNMGPQHPSTHGVLRLVLTLDGETIRSAAPTIGYLHTGIEKTCEQKKWQQVIPLIERMDYLSAQSNSMAFCMSVERLLGVDGAMPDRVKNIRILLAELQRINSHLVWLGTHGMEVGAVSVMLYCFRERELLLNINEMIAGFRLFPSYMRVGGLREDLPRGFHEAVRSFLDRFVDKLDEYEDLLTKNEIYLKRTKGVGVITKEDAVAYSLLGPIARAAGVGYDVRKAFPYLGYETYEFAVPTATDGDVFARGARGRGARAWMSRARLDHADPPHAIDDPASRRPRRIASGARDGGADSALPSTRRGSHGPAGEAYVPVEGPAGRTGFQRGVGRHEPAVAGRRGRAPAPGVPGARTNDRRRPHRRCDRGHRIDHGEGRR